MKIRNFVKKMLCRLCDNIADTKPKGMYHDDLDNWDPARAAMLHCLLNNINVLKVKGDFAELGVFLGKSSRVINYYTENRNFYLFDTFSGFDDNDLDKEDAASKLSFDNFDNVNKAEVFAYIKQNGKGTVCIREGYFPETAADLESKKYAFVHLDCDLSEPIKARLEFFWPRLSPGGVIVIHDYISRKYPGVKVVVDEFIKQHKVDYLLNMGTASGSAVIIR